MLRKDELLALLPSEFDGWKIDSDKYFDPESLYDYIDGGAELYISYGFKDVVSRRYKNTNGDEITVELFDMVETENAYGVFTQQREEESTEIAQECQIILGSIIFWRSKYFVSLMNQNETAEVKAGMRKLADIISANIKVVGEKPKILSKLPVENLLTTSIRFFKHYIWLNSYNFISSENIFNIGNLHVGVLAKYSIGYPRAILLAVDYAYSQPMYDAWIVLSKTYGFKSTKESVVLKDKESGTFMALSRSNFTIMAAYQVPTKKEALQLVNL